MEGSAELGWIVTNIITLHKIVYTTNRMVSWYLNDTCKWTVAYKEGNTSMACNEREVKVPLGD